jgi:Fe-S oxidoreductase
MAFGFLKRLLPGNTLYYPGCLTHFALPDIEKKYLELFRKLRMDVIFIPEFSCCGSPVYHAGYERDFEELKSRNLRFFKKFSVKRIITNCPACYHFLKHKYGLEVQHISQVIANHLNKRRFDEEITYHDPCHLGRHSDVYDEPRKVLERLGFKVAEFPRSREKSMCCGAGGGLRNNNPAMSKRIAKQLLFQVRTKKLITPCPMCYRQFKDNAPKGLEVLEFSEVL